MEYHKHHIHSHPFLKIDPPTLTLNVCLLVLLNQAARQVWLEALTVVVTWRAPYVEPDLYYPLLLLLPLLLPVAYGLVSPGWPLASSQAARSSLHMENSP